MKCKRHPFEGGVGVCASCLRERLLELAAAQNAISLPPTLPPPPPPPPPPPLDFPRSVSPYLSRRRCLNPDESRHFPRFYSTPQCGGVAPKRFSILSALFGNHRSGAIEPELEYAKGSKTGSWFSAFIRGRRRKDRDPPLESRESWHPGTRGMSPARFGYYDNDPEPESSSGDDAEWRMPAPTPARKFPAGGRHRAGSMTGFSVCLSPLVWASPNRRRFPAAEGCSVSGEARSYSRHVSGVSLGHNRSRKLADLGRFQ
ncbi:Protein OCTOPUS-like protein [Dioscorea alata]|uniref:Protein OCTOPUS-like protein n=1 Tax=Dioscorea alata TaxID=55571 RepID=A0ACB7V590_DIOAL|nr:Protein OCTOPUS-like protein [Dioscorea alata]